MPDYRTFFDKEMLGAWDLQGREVTVTIDRVEGGKIGHGKKASRKPILTLRGKKKKFCANVTNCKIIAQLYGKNTDDWLGKLITIYPTTTEMAGETVDCVRVRNGIPRNKAEDPPDPPEPEHEPGSDDGDDEGPR